MAAQALSNIVKTIDGKVNMDAADKSSRFISAEGGNSRSLGGEHNQQPQQQPKQSSKITKVESLESSSNNQPAADKSSESKRCWHSNSANLVEQKSTYGRLRVLAAPAAALNDQENLNQNQESNASLSHNKSLICQREQIFGISPTNRRSATSTNLRLSSSIGLPSSNQRAAAIGIISAKSNALAAAIGSGTGIGTGTTTAAGDHSVTQFALIDDENVSALQQVTKGGGALTLASQWKSQFDDSEDTTDNEWKQEPPVTIYTICNIYAIFICFKGSACHMLCIYTYSFAEALSIHIINLKCFECPLNSQFIYFEPVEHASSG